MNGQGPIEINTLNYANGNPATTLQINDGIGVVVDAVFIANAQTGWGADESPSGPAVDGLQGFAANGGRGVVGTGGLSPDPNGVPTNRSGAGVVGADGAHSVPPALDPSTVNVGVFGLGQNGVKGMSDTTDPTGQGIYGFGVTGFAANGAGVLGAVEVLAEESIGVAGFGNYGVYGQGPLGVLGVTNSGGGSGVALRPCGVMGMVKAAEPNVDQSDAVAVSGYALSDIETPTPLGRLPSKYTGLAGLFVGPVDIVDGPFVVFGGTKSVAVPHPDGSHRLLYCMESPESWFEDFGEARLVNGKAEVKISRDFAAVIKTNSYHVFVTPYGESNGLYVSRRRPAGFLVVEQGSGTRNVTFSYRIVAKRKDVKAERLAKVTLPKTPRSPTAKTPKLPFAEMLHLSKKLTFPPAAAKPKTKPKRKK